MNIGQIPNAIRAFVTCCNLPEAGDIQIIVGGLLCQGVRHRQRKKDIRCLAMQVNHQVFALGKHAGFCPDLMLTCNAAPFVYSDHKQAALPNETEDEDANKTVHRRSQHRLSRGRLRFPFKRNRSRWMCSGSRSVAETPDSRSCLLVGLWRVQSRDACANDAEDPPAVQPRRRVLLHRCGSRTPRPGTSPAPAWP